VFGKLSKRFCSILLNFIQSYLICLNMQNIFIISCNSDKNNLDNIEDDYIVLNQTLSQKQNLANCFDFDFLTNIQTQLDSINRIKSTDSTIEKILDLVAEQKIVRDQIKLIDSLSKGQRHISLVPILDDIIKNIYLVKVGEDNGMNFLTYFNFLVDANTMTIINASGKLEGQ
ncbi:MAG: hypothetical protein JXL97_10710, partial [Bacteroidales bacterium]|nr:hypothetical protein [Bacteroidales bacterium]